MHYVSNPENDKKQLRETTRRLSRLGFFPFIVTEVATKIRVLRRRIVAAALFLDSGRRGRAVCVWAEI